MNLKTVELEPFDLVLHQVEIPELHAFIGECISRRKKARILNLNVHAVNLSHDNVRFRNILKNAELVFCDGDGIRWACHYLNFPVPTKITYDRWFWEFAQFCEKEKYSLFFLGSKPGVTEAAAKKLKECYPNLKIVGMHHGFFDKTGPENEVVLNKIKQSSADIVVVGFGMPLQEFWIEENFKKLQSSIFLAGGAVFECMSGTLSKPPEWMISFQLEWLFRWFQQPIKRFKRYFGGNPLFMWRLITFKRKHSK